MKDDEISNKLMLIENKINELERHFFEFKRFVEEEYEFKNECE